MRIRSILFCLFFMVGGLQAAACKGGNPDDQSARINCLERTIIALAGRLQALESVVSNNRGSAAPAAELRAQHKAEMEDLALNFMMSLRQKPDSGELSKLDAKVSMLDLESVKRDAALKRSVEDIDKRLRELAVRVDTMSGNNVLPSPNNTSKD